MTKFLPRTFPAKRKQDHFVVISDDVLVTDLRQAKTPGVVRLKLADLTFAHFHVRSDEQGSKLGFTTGRDDFVVVGVFNDRADADSLLKEIRNEMLHVEKLHRYFNLRTFLTAMSVIITLVFLLWFWGRITQQNLPQLNDPLPLDEPMHESGMAPVGEPGRPMDADSKLTAPE